MCAFPNGLGNRFLLYFRTYLSPFERYRRGPGVGGPRNSPAIAVNYASIVLAGFLLVGCTVFQLGERYDKVIDDDLNAYQKLSAEFIKNMQLNSNNSKGAFSSEEAKKFYSTAAASLSNLQLRADLLSGRQCPTARVGQIVSAGLSAEIDRASNQLGAPETSDEAALFDTSGNCVSIVVRGVRLAHEVLEADHKELGKLTPTVALLNGHNIDVSVRVALGAIRSKNY